MKKYLGLAILLLIFTLVGCKEEAPKNKKLPGDTPPTVKIEIDGKTYETILGSYCWDISEGKSECVDMAGPEDLLKDKDPIKVIAGEKVTMKMDYSPKPNKIHLFNSKNYREVEIDMKDNQFIVPEEKGIYYYSYSVWWMDGEVENVSRGDASYVFALEVK